MDGPSSSSSAVAQDTQTASSLQSDSGTRLPDEVPENIIAGAAEDDFDDGDSALGDDS